MNGDDTNYTLAIPMGRIYDHAVCPVDEQESRVGAGRAVMNTYIVTANATMLVRAKSKEDALDKAFGMSASDMEFDNWEVERESP
jgi:hypothetical protein